MQKWIKTFRAPSQAGGEPEAAPAGGIVDTANEGDAPDDTSWGDRRTTLAGRSCVIHMLWNGFMAVGAAPDTKPWASWLVAWKRPRSGKCSRFAPTPGVPCDHAAGSGSMAAENFGRSEDPATRATKRLSAAAIAMA